MFRTRNFHISGWHVAAFFVAITLAFGIGISASGALAGRLSDTTAASPSTQKVSHPANPGGTNLVISQLYGGGGNTGAPYQNDFIEIFNPTASSISISGWSVQYASTAGTTWSVTAITGTIPSGGYYLVAEAAGSSCTGLPCGIPLPTPDITGTIAMAQANGKVALVNTTTALTGGCPIPGATVVDFVGFGTANCFEGTGAAIAPTNANSIVRDSNGCSDTDRNDIDFASSPTITPRNSASPHTNCFGTATPTPTVIPTCGPGSDYGTFPSSGATMVPGTTDIGNHCSACNTAITLPFTYNFYGAPRTTANISNNGNIQFSSNSTVFNNSCLPTGAFSDAIMAYWDGLDTSTGITTTIQPGIYTSVSGSTPNRIYNIEWRTCVFNGGACNLGLAIFEVRLYENPTLNGRFDIIYNTVEAGGRFATVGVQRGPGISYTEYSCNTSVLSSGLQLTFRPYNCGEPTNTPTITQTETPSNTPSPTRTTSPTPCPSCPTDTPTITPTASATHTTSNSVVISEFRTRGSNGGNDEFIELYNKTNAPIDISGWKVNGSSSCGTTVATRATFTNGVTIPAYSHFLLTNSQGYTGTVIGDATYSTGISDDGGIGLLNANNIVIDAVGMCITTTFHEGAPLAPTTNNQDQSYERYLGGNLGNAVDTNDNASDFFLNVGTSNPQNLSSPPVPPCQSSTVPNSIQDFSFNPQGMTINQGTTVIWTNHGAAPHTATSVVTSTEQWDSGSLSTNDTFSHAFNSPGTFTYICTIHPDMIGTITVLAGCGPSGTPTPTATAAPAGVIHGHLTWQSVAAANRPAVTGTLTLCVSGAPQAFSFTTDTSGNFTVTTGLPNGTYNWATKGGRHISNSSPADGSALVIAGGQATKEFGTQKGGNTNPDNIINATDFTNLKNQFGQSGLRSADADYNQVVNASDFTIQKNNFGQSGHTLVCP